MSAAVVPHCGARWPNLGPAGGAWTCTLDEGHDGDHEARGPGGRKLPSASSVIPQGHPDILADDDESAYVDYPTPHSDDCDCEACVTFHAERNKP